jgi:hypothetical protein
MPELCLEAHDRWPEGIFARDFDVYCKRASLVWRVWRPEELAAEVCEIIAVSCRLDNNLGVLVVLDVGNLLCDTPVSVGRSHYWCVQSWYKSGW